MKLSVGAEYLILQTIIHAPDESSPLKGEGKSLPAGGRVEDERTLLHEGVMVKVAPLRSRRKGGR